MAGSTARVVILAFFAAMPSCSDTPPILVAWPEGDFAAALLIAESAGSVQSVSGLFVVEGGTPLRMEGWTQRLDLGAEDSIVFVGVTAEDLRALAPTVAMEEMAGATASFDGESCEPGRFVDEGRRERVAVPSSMQNELHLDLESSSFRKPSRPALYLRDLVLELPLREDRCLDAPPLELVPFGDTAELLPPGTVIDGLARDSNSLLDIFRVARVDADRVLALTGAALYLFERGRPFQDDGAHAVFRWDLDVPAGPGTWYFSDFAILPEREPGTHRILAVGSLWSSPDGSASGVFELRVDEGGLHFTRTSTVYPGIDLKSMALGPNGEFFAGGGTGWMVSSIGVGAPITGFQVPGILEAIEVVHWAVGDETLHLLGTFDGGLYSGNAFLGPIGLQREAAGFQTTLTSMASRLTTEGAEVYAATSRSGLFRRAPDGQWSPSWFAVPSNVGVCSQIDGECGQRTLARKAVPRGLTAAPERGSLFFGAQTCSAILELRPERGCVAALVLGDGAAEAEMVDYPGLDWRGGRLLVGGRGGALLEAIER